MGMYLDIYKLIESTPCPKFEDVNIGFEVGKFLDDRKFATEYEGEAEYVQCKIYGCCGMSYWRPKTIDNAINWIKENIGQKGAATRLY